MRNTTLDALALKKAWFAMTDRAGSEINRVAATLPHVPAGVTFVDEQGAPRRTGSQPSRRIHPPTVRG